MNDFLINTLRIGTTIILALVVPVEIIISSVHPKFEAPILGISMFAFLVIFGLCMWLTGLKGKKEKKVDEEWERFKEEFYKQLNREYGRNWGNCL